MAIEFVKCRRKDDHSLVHDIARQALWRWPDWEPIPDADADQAAQPAESLTGADATGDTDPKPTSKSRRGAATESKE